MDKNAGSRSPSLGELRRFCRKAHHRLASRETDRIEQGPTPSAGPAASFFDEFVELESSVPDLASTLTTQAEQDAEDANINFLRGLDEGEDAPPERNEDSRRRAHRTFTSSGRRYTPTELPAMEDIDHEDPEPRNGPQDYHGWAPGTSEDDELSYIESLRSLSREERSLRRDSQDLRERMRNRLRREHLDARLAERDARLAERSARLVEYRQNHPPEDPSRHVDTPPVNESSLRTTALLQAVRGNAQFSAHSRNQLQRYILERERLGNEREEGRESSEPVEGAHSPQHRHIIDHVRLRQDIRMQQELLAEHQRRLERLTEAEWHLRNRTPPSDLVQIQNRRFRSWNVSSGRTSSDGRSVDSAIKYLGRLRLCETDQEGQETAEEVGFHRDDRKGEDFLTDTSLIPPPPESSWLNVGGVLSGSQSAVAATPSNPPNSTITTTTSLPPLVASSQYRSHIRHPTFGTTTARTTSPVRQPSTSNSSLPNPPGHEWSSHPQNIPSTTPPTAPPINDEHWPVKVTIQSIDYSSMSLSGTMEAFNVPDKSALTRESSITTYLEGDIIDFNLNTLETKSFKADVRTDATYWLRLPPFRDFKDEETMIRALTSQKWLREELMEKWILMRWKGQSHPI